MFETLSFWSIMALVTVAAMTLVAVPFVLALRWSSTPDDEAWRDRSPWLIRASRPLLRVFSYQGISWLSETRRQRIMARLQHAGVSYCLRPEEFVVLRGVTALFLFVTAAAFAWLLQPQAGTWLILLAVGAVLGLFYPDIWLNDLTSARKRIVEKEFPFFLDVLVLCMDAGLTFVSAVDTALNRLPDTPLKVEVDRFMREVRTGLSRREALEGLSNRLDIPAMANFVATVLEADETGGSVGNALREQAAQRRAERFLRAEEAANKAPVKLLFPLVVFLFPVTFIIVGFPIVMELIQSGSMRFFRG